MTKLVVLALAVWLGAGALIAQSEDSIKAKNLKEVMVDATYNSADAKGLEFIPSGKQKNSAQNGIDLLRRMAIPQLKISLSDDKVTTPAGEPVAIFINYIAASAQELEGLKTTDVHRVDYFFSPTDQRFMGERNVVNIIVQAYQYGGYTKASFYEKFLTGLSNSASLYSKFSYKKMTYDMYVGTANVNTRHQGTSVADYFRLPQTDGSVMNIQRLQTLRQSKYAYNSLPVSFRAAYSDDNFQTKNTFGFVFQETPHNNSTGSLTFLPSAANKYEYSTHADSRVRAWSYNGSFNFSFSNQYTLFFTPAFHYSRINQNSAYSASAMQQPVINNAKETSYDASFFAMGRKIFSNVHYLFLRGFGGYDHHNVTYGGNVPSLDKIIERYCGMSVQYGYYSNKISANLLFGARNEHNSVNNNTLKTFYPFVNANFGWAPDSKNMLNISFSYSKEPMNANLKSPNVLQQNELIYYTGNPMLKNAPNIMANISYNWTPLAWLQIAPFAQYYSCFNREIPVYTPYMDATAVIRKYENNGDHYRTQLGISLTAYLFNKNLQIQLTPEQMFYRSTGYYDLSCTPFLFSGAVTYYLNDFYFSGYYETRSRALWTNSGTFYTGKSRLQIIAGWAKSDLNIRIGISNPFRKSWISATSSFDTPVYSQRSLRFDTTSHCSISLSATYTFGYGKKLSRNNEVGEQGGAASSILK